MRLPVSAVMALDYSGRDNPEPPCLIVRVKLFFSARVLRVLRATTITGLFERESEYRVRAVACLFYERV